MTNLNERHRLSLIIATLGPSTDDEKELITMLMAGIARQWTDGVDIARVLHSDGEDIATKRIEEFKSQSAKRNLSTQIYLDTDNENLNLEEYTNFGSRIGPSIMAIPKSIGLENLKQIRKRMDSKIKISLRVKSSDSLDDLQNFTGYKLSNFVIFMQNNQNNLVKNKTISPDLPNNHLKYAITWYSVALSILLYFLYFRKKQ